MDEPANTAELDRMPHRIERISLHEEARNKLRNMIVRGVLSPGRNIGEVDLSDVLGISRTPLREALKLLATEGLVELQSNRGAFVMPIRPEEIGDLFDVAATLEQRAAELTALRCTDADLDVLVSMQRSMEAEHRRRRREAYFEVNQTIHRTIVAMSRNRALKDTHETLLARVQRIRFLALGSVGRWDQSIEEHREILAALHARDAAAAGTAMAVHVRHTGAHASILLTPSPAADPAPLVPQSSNPAR